MSRAIMVFPYRTPASIDPELTPLRPTPLDRCLRVLSLIAVIFLLLATAMMLSLLRDLVVLDFHPFSYSPPPTAAPPPRSNTLKAPAPGAPAAPADAIQTRSLPPTPRAFTPPLDLASLGAPTHDPALLLARATHLLDDGANITLTRVRLPLPIHQAIEEAFAPHARIAARKAWGGVEIKSLSLGSTASLAGLQRGDVVTAINGYPLIKPEDLIAMHRSLTTTGVALLEVIRGENRVVIEARFRQAPRPAVAR